MDQVKLAVPYTWCRKGHNLCIVKFSSYKSYSNPYNIFVTSASSIDERHLFITSEEMFHVLYVLHKKKKRDNPILLLVKFNYFHNTVIFAFILARFPSILYPFAIVIYKNSTSASMQIGVKGIAH